MRTIEKSMVNAITAKKRFSLNNTMVAIDNDKVDVFLHGNLIATVTDSKITICLCGWNTATTKSRLNAILSSLANTNIYTKKGVLFLGNESIKDNLTYTVKRI